VREAAGGRRWGRSVEGVAGGGGGRRRGSFAVGSIGCVSGGHIATSRDNTELSGCVLPLWPTRRHETGVLSCMAAHYAQWAFYDRAGVVF